MRDRDDSMESASTSIATNLLKYLAELRVAYVGVDLRVVAHAAGR